MAFLCVFLVVFPQYLYDILPYPVEYKPYTADHLVTQFQLLLFAGLAFFLLLPMMKRTETISLDFDWFYRVLGPKVYRTVSGITGRTWAATEGFVVAQLSTALRKNYDREQNKPIGYFGKLWPIETMVLWVVVLLAGYLMLYYI